jgi:glycine cleavage system H protein
MLTDIVYVELPAPGKQVKKAETLAVVESVKSVSDIYSPVSGEVMEVNQSLENNPALINQDPFGQGWLVKIRMNDAKELETLLDATGYDVFLKEAKH